MQRAVRWYPPAYDIRVEDVPIPRIIDADDAIVKIKLAGLCGSDLHVYRGHEDVNEPITCGHEFVGEVVELGASFKAEGNDGRPVLYSTLQIGDKVVAPFTISCGECHFCLVGFTARCSSSMLFGIPRLPGGQAQYVRVPKAGGTLFKVDSIASLAGGNELADSSCLLLADILPTGVFAAVQALQHPKVLPIVTGTSYPWCSNLPTSVTPQSNHISGQDRILTIGLIGLGPVGICAAVALIDMLENMHASSSLAYRVVAIDPLPARRDKLENILRVLQPISGTVTTSDIEDAKTTVKGWTNNGCNVVLEVVGNNSALTLAYDIVQPFGSISSVGVHQAPPVPFTGRELYDKNVSFDFGRCPVRAMLPIAMDILLKRQDIFGAVGGSTSLIERIVGFDQAAESYELYDKGKCGKILFDPWRT